MAAYKDRIDRLEALLRVIPAHGRAQDCPDPATLLERAAAHFAEHASGAARRRAIQRDLEELQRDGRIEAVNPGGKPLRYRRVRARGEADPYLWDYARRAMRELIDSALPVRRLETLWPQLLDADNGYGLGEDRLRIVSDTQRLLPAVIGEGVLADVLEALARSCTLEIGYRDAEGLRTRPILHPQALLQRGPRLYLFALKNDELEPVRMYALHRMTRSEVGGEAARQAPDFDLQDMIARGHADFGGGERLELCLRVRGYVAELLRDCPLSVDQRIDDEAEGSDFDARVRATLPATGQLLRWLLGCGDKVEVLEPAELRRVVMAQTAKAAALYRGGRPEMAGIPILGKLLAALPPAGAEESFETLFDGPHCCIERIVSHGHASPADFWYDQADDEWVLLVQGSATLGFDDGRTVRLEAGDWVAIPAGCRHRVEATGAATVWVAVHIRTAARPGVGAG